MARTSARARLAGEAPWCGTGDIISWGPAPLSVYSLLVFSSALPDLILAIFPPEGSGASVRKWALSPHLLLCSFQHLHVPISGSPVFPLPSYLP